MTNSSGNQRQRRPGGGIGGSQEQVESEGDALVRPDVTEAQDAIALALREAQEQPQSPCGCGSW